MFRKNERHLQPALISNVNDLPAKLRQRLEDSWAGTFRREFFNRLQEEAFAVLYSPIDSRPNVPVNVLVGLETLKGGFGWSDEELYDKFCYDLQVRYAVGYDNLGDGQFELRTLYNFRRRVSAYNRAQGTNLLQAAFADITDQQIVAFKVHTGQQRMDSTQIASNMLDMSRLQLLVEAVQRLHRLLSPDEQAGYAEWLAPYLAGSASNYVYRVKGRAATDAHLQALGPVLYRLLHELAPAYGQEPVYQVVQRLFADNFRLEAEVVQPKANAEIGSGCLQSLDDQEASYRRKDNQGYKGYVANLSETCNPDNPVQLITSVQVAPNNVDDAKLLCEAVPEIKARMALDLLYTDSTFGSPEADVVLLAHQVTLTQSGLRGHHNLATDKLHLADHAIAQDETGRPIRLTCAGGQTVPVMSARSTGFVAHFDPKQCSACPLHTAGQCRAYPGKRDQRFRLLFTQQEVYAAQRRRRCRTLLRDGPNFRAAVEATVRSVKHPFPAAHLPVRGRFRVTCLLIASVAMTNIRRLQRYLAAHAGSANPKPGRRTQRLGGSVRSLGLLIRLSTLTADWPGHLGLPKTCFSC
jgi:hypothetical protein